MIDKLDYSKCTLCASCLNGCPHNCIAFNKEKDSFLYPQIDYSKCTGCGLCEKKCPVLTPSAQRGVYKNVYAVINKDEEVRLKSSSGGVFSAIAEYILTKGGVVFGAAFDENFQVKHISVRKSADLHKIRGSKYVQSDIGKTYTEVKKLLIEGRLVLFSGCPCQVQALKQYLDKPYENLYTVDFICHGIGSQITFDNYLLSLESEYKSKAKVFSFRDKINGWHLFSVKVEFENGKTFTRPCVYDTYMRGYFEYIFLKKACHDCPAKDFKSGSDVTMADYWGANVVEKKLDDDKGLSLCIVNTQKGEKLLKSIDTNILKWDTDYSKAISYNKSLLQSFPPSAKRKQFFDLISSVGYTKAFDRVCKEKKMIVYKRIVRKRLGFIKKILSR
ncbi:F420H(2):quinone oxidoreductase [Clostridia bacterium]|nr:F420H(2):quinone oxidoreductase [Clostridia bacterium]